MAPAGGIRALRALALVLHVLVGKASDSSTISACPSGQGISQPHYFCMSLWARHQSVPLFPHVLVGKASVSSTISPYPNGQGISQLHYFSMS